MLSPFRKTIIFNCIAVVVVGNPNRNGVQVITITTRDVKPTNENENLLVQLATQDGHEIDYSLNSYFQPDFWAKQKEKLKDREHFNLIDINF